jgi:hypothetical protein
LPDETLTRYYENIRQQAEADRRISITSQPVQQFTSMPTG